VGLVLDAVGPNSSALEEAGLRITDRVPDLRVVIDHSPQFQRLPDLAELGIRASAVCRRCRALENDRLRRILLLEKISLGETLRPPTVDMSETDVDDELLQGGPNTRFWRSLRRSRRFWSSTDPCRNCH
jgi:hypothetical protein